MNTASQALGQACRQIPGLVATLAKPQSIPSTWRPCR